MMRVVESETLDPARFLAVRNMASKVAVVIPKPFGTIAQISIARGESATLRGKPFFVVCKRATQPLTSPLRRLQISPARMAVSMANKNASAIRC